jgi:hypothetical protein
MKEQLNVSEEQLIFIKFQLKLSKISERAEFNRRIVKFYQIIAAF